MAPQPRRVVNQPFVPTKDPSTRPWPLPSKKRTVPPHIASLMDALDGRDLEHSLRVASSIMGEGEWRSWMVKWFMRLHRQEVSRLMRRLGPMIPASRQVQR
jgi:hypothetical protein